MSSGGVGGEDGKFISESCEVLAFGSNSSSQMAMGSTEKFHKATLMSHMANAQVVGNSHYTNTVHVYSVLPCTLYMYMYIPLLSMLSIHVLMSRMANAQVVGNSHYYTCIQCPTTCMYMYM